MPSPSSVAGVYSLVEFGHPAGGTAQSLYLTATLNADGTFFISGNGSVDGTPKQGQLSGSYTVDANGIITAHGSGGIGTAMGTISPSGQLVMAEVGSGAPEIFVGVQAASGSTPASVAGTYAFADFGQSASVSQDLMGTITLNADGTFSTSFSANVNGSVLSNLNNTGHYTIAADGSIGGISLDQNGTFQGRISVSGDVVLAQVAAAGPEVVLASKLGGSGYSAASVAGSYVVADYTQFGSTYVSILSQLTLKADGTFTGTSAGSVNGTGETGVGSGHFTVRANSGLVMVDGDGGTILTGYVSSSGELVLADVTTQPSNDPEIILAVRSGGGGATAPDTTAPTLVSSSPVNGAAGVNRANSITFTFSENVMLGSGQILLLDSDGNLVASYNAATLGDGALNISANTLSVHPGSALASASGYTLVLPAGSILDLAGNAYAGNSSTGGYHFTTAGNGVTQTATAANPNLTGGTGDDTLIAGPGNGTLDGGAGNDVLKGGTGHTMMLGGAGNDILISGSGGGDTMQGGDGADLYYVNSANDLVIETAANAAQPMDPNSPASDVGRSVDKVIASVNYTLTSFVENLSLASASGSLSGTGNDLNNVLTGNESNNVLNGKGGNDTIDGGAGTDTAQYSGKLAEYTLVPGGGANATSVADKIANRDGTDSLTNIERLQFSDVKLALDLGATQAAGKAVLMMAVATSLGPALVGLKDLAGIFLNYFDSGASLQDGANLLVATGIAAAFAGGSDNASLVKMVYTDVYGKAPDAATLASLVAPLNAGTTTQAQWMADMAASTANQTHVNLVGYAATGLQYV